MKCWSSRKNKSSTAMIKVHSLCINHHLLPLPIPNQRLKERSSLVQASLPRLGEGADHYLCGSAHRSSDEDEGHMIDLCQRVRSLLSELNMFVQMKFFFWLLGSSYCWNQYLISSDQCYVGFYFELGLSVFQGYIVHQLKITNRYSEWALSMCHLRIRLFPSLIILTCKLLSLPVVKVHDELIKKKQKRKIYRIKMGI